MLLNSGRRNDPAGGTLEDVRTLNTLAELLQVIHRYRNWSVTSNLAAHPK